MKEQTRQICLELIKKEINHLTSKLEFATDNREVTHVFATRFDPKQKSYYQKLISGFDSEINAIKKELKDYEEAITDLQQ